MVKNDIHSVIRFLGQCLEEKGITDPKIVLFGSWGKGRGTEESDIGIAVISPDFENKNIWERSELIRDAEIKTIKKFVVPIDIVTLTPEEFETGTSLIAEYAKQGEIVYAA